MVVHTVGMDEKMRMLKIHFHLQTKEDHWIIK